MLPSFSCGFFKSIATVEYPNAIWRARRSLTNVSARYHYDEFGVAKNSEKFDLNWAGPDNLFGYTGLGYDFNSGHSYARARYFDSEVGRFISEDTYEGDIKNLQTLNLYTYVYNNPLRYTDPSGHYYEFKTSDYLELNILLDDARKLSKSSRTNKYYQLHKNFIQNHYEFYSIMGENRYNYLYDLLTGTSAYTNNAGNSDWAREQLVSAYFKSKEAEYIALLGMGMAGGIGGKRNVGNKTSKGKGNIPKQMLTSNKGKTIDVTPTSSHTTTTPVPNPKNGTPNSSVDILDKQTGEILTRRWYGSDGKAVRDVDYTHHKNPKTHPEAPHEHTWTYDKDGNPSRSK
ncbi:RHS repeat-associated core domain-containing protein [Paenibacillus sp. FA6]|uniref:RHS repeat-associated core domain-containing protein n=1 Tax=Paenibacillus sp. FA6 TaxID=3413029 RepID=UPI003F6594F2